MSKNMTTLAVLATLALATPALAQTPATPPAGSPTAEPAAPEAPAGEAPGEAAPEAAAEEALAVEGAEPDAVPTPAAPAAGLPEGQTGTAAPAESAETAQPGQTYISEVSGDWSVECIRTEAGNDPCQLSQLLQDDEGNNVAQISVFGLPPGQEAAAGSTIVTPLLTLLTEQLTLQVDGGEARRYPFSFCSQVGCVARVGFTDEEVNQFKRGSVATLSIVPAEAPDQRVELDVSLSGFTAGYDAVNAANADN